MRQSKGKKPTLVFFHSRLENVYYYVDLVLVLAIVDTA